MRFSIFVLLFASLSAACGQILFKMGADGKVSIADFFNRYILLGLGLYALGTAAWIYALSIERISVAYAFTSLTFVFVYAASVFILHEKLSVNAAFGVLLVLVGMYFIVGRSN